jgi:hypothetical protein
MEGEFEAVFVSKGKYRWSFTSTAGAEFVSPGTYKTKKEAVAAGELWLLERSNR